METHTTNIAELPIDSTPQNNELPENTVISTSRHIMDSNINVDPRQTVQFNQNVGVRQIDHPLILKDTHKMIILSTLLFVLLNEPLIRNYIMNILVVIFGSSLKTTTGSISKMGNVFYGVFFALTLYCLTLVIDFNSF